MSIDSGYFPVVVNPSVLRQQTKSGELQVPFFFGGSQVPTALNLPSNSFQGSGRKKGMRSKTHPGDKDFTTKKGDKVFHQDGHFVKMSGRKPFKKGGIEMNK
tara:strand:+ start:272 stop:577 length:306 start_codon:yes stop_codon:yes gene_type:complete